MKKNSIDLLFEQLVELYANQKNIESITADPLHMSLHMALLRKLLEIQEIKRLFKIDFLPAVSKSNSKRNAELHKSKYKKLISQYLLPEDMEENYNETIRLGYITLYHKYENYLTLLIKEVDNFYREDYSTKESVKDFAAKEFNIEKWPKMSKNVARVNFICNCIKHCDAFPKSRPINISYVNHPPDQRIILSKDDLMNDIDKVYSFCEGLIFYVLMTANYKVAAETPIINEEIEKDKNSNLEIAKNGLITLGEALSNL